MSKIDCFENYLGGWVGQVTAKLSVFSVNVDVSTVVRTLACNSKIHEPSLIPNYELHFIYPFLIITLSLNKLSEIRTCVFRSFMYKQAIKTQNAQLYCHCTILSKTAFEFLLS
jgi:hypothetical protein